jgi:hypothetical protein
MKNRIVVVRIGFVSFGTYFLNLPTRVEPWSKQARHLEGGGAFDDVCIGEPDMPKIIRISAPIRASTASSQKSDSHQLVSIALFSGIGLLVSLIVMILGVSGVWY